MPVALERFKNPEYTGENRCLPCTVVNVGIALLLGVAVGLLQPVAGAATLGVALAAIYLRGYLVPGTPALTKRYFPDWLLAKFDKLERPPGAEASAEVGADGPVAAARDAADGEAFADPETLLVTADVVEECAAEDDLCLTDEFAAAWRERTVAYRDDGEARRQAAADLFEREAVELKTDTKDRWLAKDGSRRLHVWISEGAMVADLAAADALGERVDWTSVAPAQRLPLLKALRPFLRECPLCDGAIGTYEDTVESCCRSFDVLAVRCRDCEEHFLEIDPETLTDVDTSRRSTA